MTISRNRLYRQVEGVATPQTATMHLVQSSRFARTTARLLLVALVLAVLAMAFLPWQQTSRGAGSVVAFVPQERQQAVESPVEGVVARIADGIVEGSEVKEGDFILEVQPFAASMVQQLEGQLIDLNTKLEQERNKADNYANQVQDFTEARDLGVEAYEQLVEAAKRKLESKKNLVNAYETKVWQAQQQYDRQEGLWKKGAKPKKEVEKLKVDLDLAIGHLNELNENIKALDQEYQAKQKELEEKRRISQTKIDSAKANQASAVGNASTIEKEIKELEIKLEELGRRVITAPRDGTVFRMQVNQRGDAVKKGEPLLVIVPETSQKAVELLVNGNDMPLIQVGQEVRLQFEGWPAVQFAGWPSVAVGTFSGMVSIVDATDNGKGKFRILVVPHPNAEQEWPEDRYLRQGVRANGWVMLRRVTLGYEIWRQLNGFPVILSDQEPASQDKDSKVPKLPK